MIHLTALVVAAALGAPAGDARRAAQLEAWGEPAAARAELERALGDDPRDATSLFVAACLELEAGDLRAAQRRAAALAAIGVEGRAQVLSALIERRRSLPAESLRDAIAPAWKRAGRPDVDESPLPGLDGKLLWIGLAEALTPERRAAMTPGERVLFTYPDPREGRADALAAALAAENPTSVDHEVLTFLIRPSGRLDPQAARAVARLGRRLAAADPENGYWDLLAWLAASPAGAPLRAADVARLERAARRPRLELPRARLVEEIAGLAVRFDPEHARCRAGMAGLAMTPPLGLVEARLAATRWSGAGGAALKRRAGKAALAIGQRLGASRAYLDRLAGLSLAAAGARLAGERGAQAEAEARLSEARYRHEKALEARRQAGFWPFAAECRDWTPDEVGYFERFLD